MFNEFSGTNPGHGQIWLIESIAFHFELSIQEEDFIHFFYFMRDRALDLWQLAVLHTDTIFITVEVEVLVMVGKARVGTLLQASDVFMFSLKYQIVVSLSDGIFWKRLSLFLSMQSLPLEVLDAHFFGRYVMGEPPRQGHL